MKDREKVDLRLEVSLCNNHPPHQALQRIVIPVTDCYSPRRQEPVSLEDMMKYCVDSVSGETFDSPIKVLPAEFGKERLVVAFERALDGFMDTIDEINEELAEKERGYSND